MQTYYLVEATLPLCLLESEKETPDPSFASWQMFEILNGCWQIHKLKIYHSYVKFKRVIAL